MKLKEYLKELNELVVEHPEALEMEVIYSHDDEGNEYQKVNNFPGFFEIENINENRFLEVVYQENTKGEIIEGTNYNAVILN